MNHIPTESAEPILRFTSIEAAVPFYGVKTFTQVTTPDHTPVRYLGEIAAETIHNMKKSNVRWHATIDKMIHPWGFHMPLTPPNKRNASAVLAMEDVVRRVFRERDERRAAATLEASKPGLKPMVLAGKRK